MNTTKFKKYYLISLSCILLASFYPMYMGVKVLVDMLRYGTVYSSNYPKYVIPYTPIAIALIAGVAILPLLLKKTKKFAFPIAVIAACLLFLGFELLFEYKLTVETIQALKIKASLVEWQRYMCAYMTDEIELTLTASEIGILLGEYNPAFKLHFYIISFVIISSILNCIYGFAEIIITGSKSRIKHLIIQSVAAGSFLCMCIWACFTAFYRTGTLHISVISAILMGVFFVLFGVTMGIYVMSFTIHKRKLISVVLPSVTASLVTIIMYIGEMILLNGKLYRFGEGFLFNEIPGIVFAPIDIAVIVISGVATAVISNYFSISKPLKRMEDGIVSEQ